MLRILILFCSVLNIRTAPVILPLSNEQTRPPGKYHLKIKLTRISTTSVFRAFTSVAVSNPSTPYTIVTSGQGKAYEWQSDTITVRLTGGQTQNLFTMTEDAMKPTFKLGLHLHRKHAESFHILEGEVEFRLGSQTHVARAGTTIHVPPNTPHAARVTNGKPARMIMLYAPSGIELFLSEMKTFTDAQFADAQFMKAFNDRYDNIVLE